MRRAVAERGVAAVEVEVGVPSAHPHPVGGRGAAWPSSRFSATKAAGSAGVVRGRCGQVLRVRWPAANGVAHNGLPDGLRRAIRPVGGGYRSGRHEGKGLLRGKLPAGRGLTAHHGE